jgi:hypothetical protein
MRIFYLLPFVTFFAPAAFTQNLSSSREWSAGFGFGGILAHNGLVRHLAQSHPIQFNFDHLREQRFENQTYPMRQGLALHYLDYQSAKLGRSLTALVFIEPALSRHFSLRIGSGFAWNSHPFAVPENPSNNMLGSAFSGAMQGRIMLNNDVKNLRFKLGIGLTHFSNGAFSLPNMGINNFYLYSSIGWLKSCPQASGLPELTQQKAWIFGLSGSISLVERYPLTGKKYPVLQLQARTGFRNQKRSTFTTGFDLMYNFALASRIREFPEEGSSVFMTGIPIGHSWQVLPSWSILTEAGVYLVRHNKLYPALYQRYGFRHHFKNGLAAGLLLKTHAARAECMEFNLSYWWNK